MRLTLLMQTLETYGLLSTDTQYRLVSILGFGRQSYA